MDRLRDHILKNLPRCLNHVHATPVPLIETRGVDSVAFRLSQTAIGDAGEIHGYDLRDYNSKFYGSCEFISPLAIRWRNAPLIVIFDSDIHGYHGERECSAKLHGDGPSKQFSCPKCGGTIFTVSVQFDYLDACYDLWKDEPDIAIQDYFSNIMVDGECAGCGHVSRVLDMDL